MGQASDAAGTEAGAGGRLGLGAARQGHQAGRLKVFEANGTGDQPGRRAWRFGCRLGHRISIAVVCPILVMLEFGPADGIGNTIVPVLSSSAAAAPPNGPHIAGRDTCIIPVSVIDQPERNRQTLRAEVVSRGGISVDQPPEGLEFGPFGGVGSSRRCRRCGSIGHDPFKDTSIACIGSSHRCRRCSSIAP